MYQDLGINDEQGEKLSDLTLPDFYHYFQEYRSGKISLMLVTDADIDYTVSKTPTARIAMAIFNSLTTSEKLEVMEYAEWHDDNKGGDCEG